MAVVITTLPSDNETTTAIHFIKAAIANNICVVGVFFYQQGVLNAAKQLTLANDEFQPKRHWQDLATQHNITLCMCSTAAEKYGLLPEAYQGTPEEFNLIDPNFIVSGLGELVELTNKADRVIQL